MGITQCLYIEYFCIMYYCIICIVFLYYLCIFEDFRIAFGSSLMFQATEIQTDLNSGSANRPGVRNRLSFTSASQIKVMHIIKQYLIKWVWYNSNQIWWLDHYKSTESVSALRCDLSWSSCHIHYLLCAGRSPTWAFHPGISSITSYPLLSWQKRKLKCFYQLYPSLPSYHT